MKTKKENGDSRFFRLIPVKWLSPLLFMLVAQGCVSANIPHYLNDHAPYKKSFLTDYETTLTAVQEALREMGWKVTQTSNPVVYEQGSLDAASANQEILLFTDIRQTAMFLGTRYSKLNVYVRKIAQGTEVEIRYVTVTSTPFKSFESYKHESAAQKIFHHIEKVLTR